MSANPKKRTMQGNAPSISDEEYPHIFDGVDKSKKPKPRPETEHVIDKICDATGVNRDSYRIRIELKRIIEPLLK